MSLTIKDGDGNDQSLKTTADGSDLVPHHRIDATVAPTQYETGIKTVIGQDDSVAQNKYTTSFGHGLGGTYSGMIRGLMLVARTAAAGAIIHEQGCLLIFDGDPATTAGDAAIAGAAYQKLIAKVEIAAADYHYDANGGVVFKEVNIPFHALQNLYFAYQQIGATNWNAVAGDDQILELNAWYERNA